MSKTKRGHSLSSNPGPGSYNAEYRHEINKNTPANFGSSCPRSDIISNKQTLEYPPVGYYNKPQLKNQLNRIRSMKQAVPKSSKL